MTFHPFIEELHVVAGSQTLAATKVLPEQGAAPSILTAHGYGPTATRHTVRYLLDELAEQGFGSLCFEFSGNGDSTGTLDEATLSGRHAELLAVAAELDTACPPVLIGTSMGAHLAASAVERLEPAGLVLFCPAAYPAAAADRPFGQGLIRAGAHPDSPAFAGIKRFHGDLIVIAARQDQVVPAEVAQAYFDQAVNARSRSLIWIEDCDHLIHRRLPSRPLELAQITEAILSLVAKSRQTV
jgi:esterase/lipase